MPARTNVISLAIILTVLFAGEAPAQYVAPHRPVLRPPVYLPPVQQAPVQRAPVQQAPVQQAPAQQAPAQQQTAQQTQAWDWCKNQGGSVAVDLRVSGCTTVIQSGRENPKNLAFAFNSRGNAYWAKKDYDHAVADYDQAIKLIQPTRYSSAIAAERWSTRAKSIAVSPTSINRFGSIQICHAPTSIAAMP